MGKLNKFTAFMGNKFQPVFGKIVYRNMRRKPIVPKELKRLSDLAPLDKDKVQLVAHRGLSGAYPENTAPSFEAAGKHGGYFGLEYGPCRRSCRTCPGPLPTVRMKPPAP